MRSLFSRVTAYTQELFFAIGCVCTVLSLGILALHSDSFYQRQEDILQLSSRLPSLVSRVAELDSNRRATQYFLEHSLNAKEELTRAYVLPDTFSLPLFERRFRQISSLFPSIQPQSFTLLSSSSASGSMVHSVSVTLHAPFSSFTELVQFLDYSGKFFIADVLPVTTQSSLLDLLSRENPDALLSFRQFLFTDLLTYSADPRAIHEQFFASLPLSLRDQIIAKSASAGLSHARTLLTPLAPRLRAERLFPFALLSVRSFEVQGTSITLLLDVYSGTK